MSNDDDRPYEVGRGRPPKHSRFRMGQSGNPRGRPRKAALTPSDIVAKVRDERIRVTINGKEQWMTAFEAAFRRVVNTVMTKGNAADLERLLRINDKYGSAPEHDRMAEAMAESDKVVQRMFQILDRTVNDDPPDNTPGPGTDACAD